MKYILIHDLPYQEEEIGITEFYDENDLDKKQIYMIERLLESY